MDGKPLPQSFAILRFCGHLAHLLPTDAFEAAQVDAFLYSIMGASSALHKLHIILFILRRSGYSDGAVWCGSVDDRG